MTRRAETIELVPGVDFEVLRGPLYRYHREETCEQCQTHPMAGDSSWPKCHVIKQSKRSSLYPIAFSGPPVTLYLLPPPEVHLLDAVKVYPIIRSQMSGFGSILSDIFDFFAAIISAVLSWVGSLLARLAYDLTHPMSLLKDFILVVVGVFSGSDFLWLLKNNPLTGWLYGVINYMTGGFLDNLDDLLTLPGQLATGETITRSQLLHALGALVIVLQTALAFVTGGALIAVIGLSVTLLKAGPIGQTVIGRDLLDIAGIGLTAICGGSDIVEAFVNAGSKVLAGTVVGDLAAKLHLGSLITSIAKAGAGAGTGALTDAIEDSGDSISSSLDEATSAVTDVTQTEASFQPIALATSLTPSLDAVSSVSDTSVTSTPSLDDSEVVTTPSEESAPSSDDSSDETSAESSPEENEPTDETVESSEPDEEASESDEPDENEEDDEDNTAADALKVALTAAQVAQKLTTPVKTASPKKAAIPSQTPFQTAASTALAPLANLLGISLVPNATTTAAQAAQNLQNLMIGLGVTGAIAVTAISRRKRKSA